MLHLIRTFVVFAEVGSLQRAADRLLLTPSAVTKQIQRLEAALGAEVLDRRAKPPSITATGQSVLEQGRGLLRSFEALKASTSSTGEPAGTFKLGLAHGLAVGSIAAPLRRMTDRFPQLHPQIAADMTQNLLERVRNGDLDAAVMLLPDSEPHPPDLLGTVVAPDHMLVVGPSDVMCGTKRDFRDFGNQGWVLNPPGCLVRESFRRTLEAGGTPMRVAAEVHNLELQLSLVAAGYGLGLFPTRFLSQHSLGDMVACSEPGLRLPVTIAFVKAGNLGRLEAAATVLQSELSAFFVGNE